MSEKPPRTIREITLASNQKARMAYSLRLQGKLLREIGECFGVGVEGARRWVIKGKHLYERERKHQQPYRKDRT